MLGPVRPLTHHLEQLQSALCGPDELQLDAGTARATTAVDPSPAGLHAALHRRHDTGAPHDSLPRHCAARHCFRAFNTKIFTLLLI